MRVKKPSKGITKRGKRWQVRVRYKGHYIYGVFEALETAENYLKEERDLIDGGRYYKEDKTLEEVYKDIDKNLRLRNKKKVQSSRVTDNLFYNHIVKKPYGLNKDKPIHEFTEQEITGIQETILSGDLKPRTQVKALCLLKQIFRTAYKRRWCIDDYTVLIDFPTVEESENKVFTEKEQALLYEQAEKRFERNPNYLCMIELGIYGGLRRAELRGLRWENVDFENHVFHVVEQFQGNLKAFTGTKTKSSIRSLGMLPPFESTLKRIYDRARTQKGFKETDCVLTAWRGTYTGKPLCNNCFTGMLGALTVASGIPKETRLHVLRKTCCTNMLNKGYTLPQVSSWLGHSKEGITWKAYSNRDSIRESTFERMQHDYLQKGA